MHCYIPFRFLSWTSRSVRAHELPHHAFWDCKSPAPSVTSLSSLHPDDHPSIESCFRHTDCIDASCHSTHRCSRPAQQYEDASASGDFTEACRRFPRRPSKHRADVPSKPQKLLGVFPILGFEPNSGGRYSWPFTTGTSAPNTHAAVFTASRAAGKPAYTAICRMISRISSRVQPTFIAPRIWSLSSACG